MLSVLEIDVDGELSSLFFDATLVAGSLNLALRAP